MPTVDPVLSAAGRVGGLKRVANLDEAGRLAHVEMMNAARRRLRELATEVDPDGSMDPERRKREARLRYDIEVAQAKLAALREQRRIEREEAELVAELDRLTALSA
jgi:hypothetical protein